MQVLSGRDGTGLGVPACRAQGRWDAVWSLRDGLQGNLSSTGQVQCGQVHCRLPYTAPPVHLKADMDGPLSNRGEKVNGARLGLLGQSLPAGLSFWQYFPSSSGKHASLWQTISAQPALAHTVPTIVI